MCVVAEAVVNECVIDGGWDGGGARVVVRVNEEASVEID